MQQPHTTSVRAVIAAILQTSFLLLASSSVGTCRALMISCCDTFRPFFSPPPTLLLLLLLHGKCQANGGQQNKSDFKAAARKLAGVVVVVMRMKSRENYK
jgi:hypothetical protein